MAFNWPLSRRKSRAGVFVVVVIIFVLDYKFWCLFRLFPRTQALDDVPLPQDPPLKNAGLTLQFKIYGKDALQNPQTVQDLLGRVAFRGTSLHERRRKRGDIFCLNGGERVVGDEVEEARGYDADEGHNVLGSLNQCSANFGNISSAKYGRKKMSQLTILKRKKADKRRLSAMCVTLTQT